MQNKKEKIPVTVQCIVLMIAAVPMFLFQFRHMGEHLSNFDRFLAGCVDMTVLIATYLILMFVVKRIFLGLGN